MIFWTITVALFIISFIWAFLSLKKDYETPDLIDEVRDELQKEKILFQAE